MGAWNIYTTKSGKIAVVTPWHEQIVTTAKKKMGEFKPINVGEKQYKSWMLDPSHREAMEALCREVFDAPLIERVITWTAIGGCSLNSPKLDGYDLVSFGRDHYSFKRFETGMPVQIVEALSDDLSTGGSRNNPRLYGSVTLKVRCRPSAEASGHDWNVEVIS